MAQAILDNRSLRTHRRSFQNWSYDNGHDLSKRANWWDAILDYGIAHNLDQDDLNSLYAAHGQNPRVVTGAWLD